MIATVWLTTAIMVVWGALIVCACMLSRVRKLTRIAVKLRFGQPLTERESALVSRLDGPR
jgi:hypothetical protein